ncbi:MAG TPA: outer membrane protein assembly factor BamA [Smithellaceae bacterium]|nr:outer membrane protein assembly factor BamA [Smithellaceae bacterium]HOQ41775.1 outer membrane protein assembly factor BamA [Smithellaceae bacterium]HPL65748.1 outer membrane protein assembly factor BamA [Smithellaceae bacterium]
MIFNKKTFQVLLVAILCVFFVLGQARAENIKKICIMPFDVHAGDQSGNLQESFYNHLVKEFQKEKTIEVLRAGDFTGSSVAVTKSKAISTGKALKADYVVIGSITQFGETISVDAQIINIAQEKVSPSASVQGKESTGQEALAAEIKTSLLAHTGFLDTIARVDIAGNYKVGAEAIRQQLRSKAGSPLSEDNISADIKTIYKMGLFEDVSAKVTSEAEGKVLTFTVIESGLISEIRLIGNKKLDRDDILGVMTVKTRQSLNQGKIKEDIEKIKALYDSKGYYNAEISDRIEKEGEKNYVLILDIQENKRIYIRSITFEGNEAFTEKDLLKQMSTKKRTLLGFFTDDGILQGNQLKQDVQKISSFYFNNGFINSQVGDPVITRDAKGIYIKMTIQEGKRFNVGKVQISGDEIGKSRESLFALLKTQEGKNYNREAVMRDIETITVAANDEGYAHADVTPKVVPHEAEQLVDIDFQLTKGEPVHIARIGISGNTTTRDKVIRRQLAIVEGDLYSTTKLKQSYNNLNALRYFEEVDFQTEKAPDNKMDVNIRVKEKNTGMFMIGAGYSAVDQAVVMAQVSQQNFLGYGQILSLKASLGSKTNNYELSFIEPWLFDLPLWTKADVWKYKKEYDSYTLDTKGAGLTFAYPIWNKISGSIGYRFSMDNIQDVNYLTASYYILAQQGERTTSSVTVGLGYDTTDDTVFPTKGIKASVSVQHAGNPFGGNTHFTKYSGYAAGYYPLFWDIVLGARGRIGYLQNNDDNDTSLPIYERYVLGGINSLRGLRYVGPINAGTSDVIGGTSMLTFSLEVVFPLIKDAGMKGVIFYDAGNTWNGGYHLDDLRMTAGGGIRWYSPIGPLRLEYGYVLDRKGLNDDASGRWEFTIGMFM